MKNPNCVFCKITAGILPAQILHQDDQVTAFQDSHPIAPVHLLVIPNDHIASVNDLTADSEPLIGHMIVIAKRMAEEAGVGRSGFRLVFNTGPDAGQSVFHLHLHIIGGRHLPFRFE